MKKRNTMLTGTPHAPVETPRTHFDPSEIVVRSGVAYPGPRNEMASKYDAVLAKMQIGDMAECPTRSAVNAMVKAAVKWAKLKKKPVIFRTAVLEGKHCLWMLEAPKPESQIEALGKALGALKGKV